MRTSISPSRLSLTAATVTALLAGAQLATALPAHAEDGPSKPPGTEMTAPPPEIDANAPGLKLGDGATLDDPRVVDIVSVVETFGTEEGGGAESPPPSTEAPGTEEPDPEPEQEDAPSVERQESTSTNTKFTLQSDLLFPKNSAKLNSKANARLKEIALEINKQSPEQVNVFGFTDDLGSYQHGLKLSKERATAVHQELLKNVEGTDITFNIRGYSEDYPIADNGTEEGRQKNRRVEISFPLQG